MHAMSTTNDRYLLNGPHGSPALGSSGRTPSLPPGEDPASGPRKARGHQPVARGSVVIVCHHRGPPQRHLSYLGTARLRNGCSYTRILCTTSRRQPTPIGHGASACQQSHVATYQVSTSLCDAKRCPPERPLRSVVRQNGRIYRRGTLGSLVNKTMLAGRCDAPSPEAVGIRYHYLTLPTPRRPVRYLVVGTKQQCVQLGTNETECAIMLIPRGLAGSGI